MSPTKVVLLKSHFYSNLCTLRTGRKKWAGGKSVGVARCVVVCVCMFMWLFKEGNLSHWAAGLVHFKGRQQDFESVEVP